MNFSIIIPARNESDSIEKTIRSLINQTLKPLQIIVVDDSSTDDTVDVLKRLRLENPLVEIVQKKSNLPYSPGGKIVETFNAGLPFLHEKTDVICKFDADLIFPENYLLTLEKHYSDDEKVGMCGGFCYIEKNGTWILENLTNKDHLRGAVKSYRKACFLDIGGLKMAMGWDTADELLARYFGWKVKTDSSLIVKHIRPTGQGYNRNAHLSQGSVFYRLRYGFLLSIIATAKLSLKKKKWSLFKNYLQGYLKAKKEKQPFLVTEEQGKWIRNYRWKNIKSKLRI